MIFSGVVRIGVDPTVRYTGEGNPVMELALAYNYGKKVDGKRPTQWIYASLWGSRVEGLQPYLKKGAQIYVALTDLNVTIYNKKDGTQGFSMRANINQLELLEREKKQEIVEKQEKQEKMLVDVDDNIPF